MRRREEAGAIANRGLYLSTRIRTAGILSSLWALLFVPTAAISEAGGGDKYQWLEDVHGKRALAWVREENERSAKILAADPHFAALEATALKILESEDRLPAPEFLAGAIYNTWQDARHVRGIVRRASLAEYLRPQPHWQTVLDYDALAKQDHENWVAGGLDCALPEEKTCLVSLSAGGEDALTGREFNLQQNKFVAGGFVLPRSKQSTAWLNDDTMLVARDWGGGTMTKSGYPFVVKLWQRGEPLEKAKEIFRGRDTDMMATPVSLIDGDGHRAGLVSRT
jgi:prolyl oligopeptidase